jgi:predicted  nucleic acid-binding Zn-ribbon protein
MPDPTTTADQAPSLSAAELRRRLLASTPPPVAATASGVELNVAELAGLAPQSAAASGTWAAGQSSADLLARLRMPGGKSGSIAVPPPRSVAAPPAPPPEQPGSRAVPAARRTPAPGRPLDPASAIAGALNQLASLSGDAPLPTPGLSRAGVPMDDSPLAEIQRLRGENKELRTLLDEMKHLLQEASDAEQQFTAKEKEYKAALEQKDAQVEELSIQLGTIEEQIAKGELAPPPPVPKTRSELEEWSDELEKENAKLVQERKRLEEERRQLRDDEEGLETQMREMEIGMARERAILARQETELKRLMAEIQHELDLLQRGDATLRDQMAKFSRRAQDVMTRPPGASGTRR